MSYTATQIKSLTSIPAVATWTDEKCLAFISMAETWINGYGMNSSMTGYTEAYNGAVLIAFDCLAENPTGRSSFAVGKRSVNFNAGANSMILALIGKYISGGGATIDFQGAKLERDDIGTR